VTVAPQPIPVSGTGRPSKLDVQGIGYGSGLTAQDEPGLPIREFENVGGRHVDLAGDDRADARTAATLTAGMGHVNSGVDHRVDERGLAGPAQSVPLPVEVNMGCSDGDRVD
jgi:hypothetical protein